MEEHTTQPAGSKPPNLQTGKELGYTLSGEDTKRPRTHKKGSTSVITEEMEIKPVRCRLAPLGMAAVKKQKQKTATVGEDVERLAPLCPGAGTRNWSCCRGKPCGSSSKKSNIKLPYHLAILFVGNCSQSLVSGSGRDVRTPVFRAALSAIATGRKRSQCPSAGERVSTACCVHAIGQPERKTGPACCSEGELGGPRVGEKASPQKTDTARFHVHGGT